MKIINLFTLVISFFLYLFINQPSYLTKPIMVVIKIKIYTLHIHTITNEKKLVSKHRLPVMVVNKYYSALKSAFLHSCCFEYYIIILNCICN